MLLSSFPELVPELVPVYEPPQVAPVAKGQFKLISNPAGAFPEQVAPLACGQFKLGLLLPLAKLTERNPPANNPSFVASTTGISNFRDTNEFLQFIRFIVILLLIDASAVL